MEMENWVPGQTVKVNLKLIIVVNFENHMYTPDLKTQDFL
jgi:hypothetical protein